MTTLEPYKGLTNTKDTPHIATDVYMDPRSMTPTGHKVQSEGSNYAKLQRAANPDYYAKANPSAAEYVQYETNNGQYINNPSRQFNLPGGTSVTAVYNQATNHLSSTPGYTPEARFDAAKDSPTSNYAMTRTNAAYYNQPIHVIGRNQPTVAGPSTTSRTTTSYLASVGPQTY